MQKTTEKHARMGAAALVLIGRKTPECLAGLRAEPLAKISFGLVEVALQISETHDRVRTCSQNMELGVF